MTRENKVALVIGFALVLFVGILVSDHLSKAQTQQSANLTPTIDTLATTAGPPARFVDLRTTLPARPAKPVPLIRQPVTAQPVPAPTQAVPVEELAVMTPASERTYEVRSGESLSTICQHTYGTAALTAALAAHNGISDPDRLWAGRRLSLPAADVLTGGHTVAVLGDVETPARWGAYRIQEGDSLSEIARRLMGSADRWRQLYELNQHAISDPDNIRVGTVLKVPSG